jgi:hypothetical protein
MVAATELLSSPPPFQSSSAVARSTRIAKREYSMSRRHFVAGYSRAFYTHTLPDRKVISPSANQHQAAGRGGVCHRF